MVKRIAGENSSECTAHAGAVLFIGFLRLPQRCKYSTAAEYEKYERAEIKIRR